MVTARPGIRALIAAEPDPSLRSVIGVKIGSPVAIFPHEECLNGGPASLGKFSHLEDPVRLAEQVDYRRKTVEHIHSVQTRPGIRSS